MREMEILKGLEGGENMAVQFVDHLLALGLRKKASDIHLEPGEEQMTVRMRTDGRLKVCAAVEMRHHPMILTALPLRSISTEASMASAVTSSISPMPWFTHSLMPS